MRTQRLLMPIEVIRVYKKLPLRQRKALYQILRTELDYGPNLDNSILEKCSVVIGTFQPQQSS
jgi:hypothetical protein